LLNARGEIVATHEVARGSVSSVSIEPASILRAAVVAAAPSLIIVHNHPSGNPSPSAEDIAFTHKVVRAARVLGIQVLDHIVIAEDGYASLLDRGLLRTAHDVP
jgi:DNA repair protein RadC